MSKGSFIMHLDSLSVLDELTDEQAGKLFKAIKKYQAGECIGEQEFWLKIAFLVFKNQFDRDADKYEKFTDKQSERGTIGNLKRWNPDLYKKYINKEITLEEASIIAKYRTGDKSIAEIANSVSVSDSKSKSESDIITRTPDFFQFSFSKTQFEHLPEEFQSQTDKENWVKWQNLNEHIDRNLKEIRKIEQQMNHKEYLNFKEKYIGKNKLALNTVLKLLENFNNHRQAAQKYLAVYPALCKWADIELSQKQSSVVNQ